MSGFSGPLENRVDRVLGVTFEIPVDAIFEGPWEDEDALPQFELSPESADLIVLAERS